MAGSGKHKRLENHATLLPLIRRDQLDAIRQNIPTVAPVVIIISAIVLFVSIRYQHGTQGIEWFTASAFISLLRTGQCYLPLRDSAEASMAAGQQSVERHLQLFSITSLISGVIWALIPVLCNGYTSPQTLFYLTVVCGISAGAIANGAPYWPMPACFILPPLLSVFCCLLYTGGFDRDCLAATVLVYMIGLLRVVIRSEVEFRKTSLLKNEAVILSQSLRDAHSHALVVAEQMSYRATHDELTNLLNRAGFMREVERRIGGTTSTFCLMLLDLDGFKSVNDVFGHHAGDRVLVEVARRLSETLGQEFTISRLGGDEFAIFYDSWATDAFPTELARRLITSIEVPFASFDAGRLGACVGLYIGSGHNVTQLLTCADEALYVAKAAGRNEYYVFDDNLRDRLEMRRDVERDLLQALADSALEMWYQPIFGENGKKLVNLEALLRWNHPEYGMVPPEELISTAAMAGLAEPLLRFVFGQVCAMIIQLRTCGLDNVRVAMNISPREISRIAVDEMILSGLKTLNCPAEMLEIEITEETALDIRSVQDKLIRLSNGGVQIAIDDFGVGYSSLATLRQPHINKIKIDRSFVRDIASSSGNQILVQSILHLGHSLGIQVVAEGVETSEDQKFLDRIGCDLMQGYYFCPPTPHATMLEWLQSQGLQN